MSKGKRKTIDIATVYGTRRVKPIARSSVYAIHRAFMASGYALTHVPTGVLVAEGDSEPCVHCGDRGCVAEVVMPAVVCEVVGSSPPHEYEPADEVPR